MMHQSALNAGTLRVLVVEDEPRLRDLLAGVLPDMGYEPVTVATAEKALRAMEQQPCDIVLLDLNLPVMNGLELLTLLRERWPDTAVIIVTGFGDLEAAKKAIRLDVTDFLTKPCALGELEIALDRARRWRLHRSPRDEQPAPEPFELQTSDQQLTIDDAEYQLIMHSLRHNRGNRSLTAAELGISRRTLYNRLTQYKSRGLFDEQVLDDF